MTFMDVMLFINAPSLIGILVWVIKVEKRLTVIEITCKLKNAICGEEK